MLAAPELWGFPPWIHRIYDRLVGEVHARSANGRSVGTSIKKIKIKKIWAFGRSHVFQTNGWYNAIRSGM